MSLEDQLKIALVGEEEDTLEEAFMADTRVSIEMLTGKIQHSLPPPTTTADVMCLKFSSTPRSMVFMTLGALGPKTTMYLNVERSSSRSGSTFTLGIMKGTV